MSSHPTDTYEIRFGVDGKCGLGAIINLTGLRVSHSGLNEDISNIQKFLTAHHLRSNTLNILSEQELRSALMQITNPPFPVSTSIRREDSIVCIALISRGDEQKIILPDGSIVLHAHIEQFFNEDNCHILRGKPKFFFHLKYYTKVSESQKPIDLQPPSTPVTKLIDLHQPLSSTNLHILSYCIYEFGLPMLYTENKGYIVLQRLAEHFSCHGHEYDVVSCLKKFLENLYNSITWLNGAVNPDAELRTICCIMKNSLESYLIFPPPPLERHEEQDIEVYLSDGLEHQVSLSCQTSPGKASPLRTIHRNSSLVISPYTIIRSNMFTRRMGQEGVNPRVFDILHSRKTKTQRKALVHTPNLRFQPKKSTTDPNTSLILEDSIEHIDIYNLSQ
eukprot:TRINITY_DN1034_c0_g1_i1.p1 TRINITY_DN1034_c0_g1~~TRINITY_DN1034_c0_g1_i1.p1  ORF type:complete len:412 (+),score=33.62 TRINITY_DN1034_c0_g1_i1:69-1238(+)